MNGTSVRDLLDEAASRALRRDGAGPVDAAAVLGRALAARRAVRRRRLLALTGAAAAVVVALGAGWVAGVPGPARATPSAPGTPQGLPDQVWTPPVWTPSVLDEPIERAGLLLAGVPLSAEPAGDPAVLLERGFVVVSADGRQYRRLPHLHDLDPRLVAGVRHLDSRSIAAAALSPSGRTVAWLELPAAPTGYSELVVVDLATGRQTRTSLPGQGELLSWLPGDAGVLVTGQLAVDGVGGDGGRRGGGSSAGGSSVGWHVHRDGSFAEACQCGVDGVLVGATGGPRVLGAADLATGAAALPSPQYLGAAAAAVRGGGVAVSPDGRRYALATGSGSERRLEIVDARDGSSRVLEPALPAGVRVLGWTAAGVLVGGEGVWAVSPGTGAVRPVTARAGEPSSSGSSGSSGTVGMSVAGVAADLAGASVAGRPPNGSRLTGAYLRYRFAASPVGGVEPAGWLRAGLVGGLLAVCLGAVVTVRRRRR